MKKLALLLTAIGTLALCSTTYASITSADWMDDRDGVLVCTNWSYSSDQLSMQGLQYDVPGQGTTGHMLGNIYTDTPVDPTITLASSVENDTGGAWLAYQINIAMNNTFSIKTSLPAPFSTLEANVMVGSRGVSV